MELQAAVQALHVVKLSSPLHKKHWFKKRGKYNCSHHFSLSG